MHGSYKTWAHQISPDSALAVESATRFSSFKSFSVEVFDILKPIENKATEAIIAILVNTNDFFFMIWIFEFNNFYYVVDHIFEDDISYIL